MVFAHGFAGNIEIERETPFQRAFHDEVLVSSTVKDLVAGSDLQVQDRGLTELEGVSGEWRLFAVR